MKSSYASLIAILVLLTPAVLSAQYSYRSTPAIEVISDIRDRTPYRFLYREALLADIQLSFEATRENLLLKFEQSLVRNGLRMQLDDDRNQIILLRNSGPEASAEQPVTISGQVVDARTGERLPYAVVTWQDGDETRGRATGSSGQFRIRVETGRPNIRLGARYIGYSNATVNIKPNLQSSIEDLTIRLTPQSVEGEEILVTDRRRSAPQDSALTGLVRSDRFSPMGENNAVRALQILPSVGLTSAVNDGMNVRGSTPDGFVVKLDDMVIFNQSHLFGLLDSFNGDAILNSGFFYDIAPADIDIPAGGKLSLITKNGSLNNVEGAAGISSTGGRATAGGPLKKGKSSWLLSARGSYLNQLNWFNNDEIIQWGMDIDRPTSAPDNRPSLSSSLVTPGSADMWFYDLHGKLYFESTNGSRTILSGYLGGDSAKQQATRTVRSLQSENGLDSREVTTSNDWTNGSISATHQRFLGDRVYSKTTAGISSYETQFRKDDFTFTRVQQMSGNLSVSAFVSGFTNRSSMTRGELQQTFDIYNSTAPLTAGFNVIYHKNEYAEESFDRPLFFTRSDAIQADLFLQTDYEPAEWLETQLGGRSHYFSDGDYWRFSPRLKVTLFGDRPLSVTAGFSQNHQFSHRVRFSNVVTPDVWILSSQDQPPTSVDHFSTAIESRLFGKHYLKVGGYIKNYRNLRQHEVNTQTLTNTFSEAPWFFENRGYARGLELLFSSRFRHFNLTQSYTLASVELQNDLINNGNRFYADWDRRHHLSTQLELPVSGQLSLYGSFTLASGAPNNLLTRQNRQIERLDLYHRLDLSADYSHTLGSGTLTATISIFNVYDRQNAWYKTLQLFVDESRTVPVLRPAAVDVYDLGLRPSFDLGFTF